MSQSGAILTWLAETPGAFAPDDEARLEALRWLFFDKRLSAGAGFLYVLCGDIMKMPGLPSRPAGEKVDIKPADLSQMATEKLGSILAVAESALAVAKEYAASQRAYSMTTLMVQLGLLAVAIALSATIMLIRRRMWSSSTWPTS